MSLAHQSENVQAQFSTAEDLFLLFAFLLIDRAMGAHLGLLG
jgi:hypothetical protein